MISLRFVIPAVLVAAAMAGCLTYFVPPRPPVAPSPKLPEKMPELRMGIPANVDPPKAQEAADDFLQAAQAILKKEPNAQASADKPTIITGHIPLPKKRPIPRLKTAQGMHWARLFNGRFDHEYMQGVRTIGNIHNKIGLEPRWYIGGYNFVLTELVALAVSKYRWKLVPTI